MIKSRRKRKKEAEKRRRLPTIVRPTRNRVANPLPLGVARFRPKQTVFASQEILIAAPIESCFNTLTKQLEQPHEWDPIIVNAWPVSDIKRQLGATSQVTLNLGGKKVESQAMISRYHPNRAMSWIIPNKPRVREDWQLKRKPHCTQVHVTLALEFDSWVVRRLIYKVMRSKQVEQDLGIMLIELKNAVESISQDQRLLTGEVGS